LLKVQCFCICVQEYFLFVVVSLVVIGSLDKMD